MWGVGGRTETSQKEAWPCPLGALTTSGLGCWSCSELRPPGPRPSSWQGRWAQELCFKVSSCTNPCGLLSIP